MEKNVPAPKPATELVKVTFAASIFDQATTDKVATVMDKLIRKGVSVMGLPVERGGSHAECCPLPNIVAIMRNGTFRRYEGVPDLERFEKEFSL